VPRNRRDRYSGCFHRVVPGNQQRGCRITGRTHDGSQGAGRPHDGRIIHDVMCCHDPVADRPFRITGAVDKLTVGGVQIPGCVCCVGIQRNGRCHVPTVGRLELIGVRNIRRLLCRSGLILNADHAHQGHEDLPQILVSHFEFLRYVNFSTGEKYRPEATGNQVLAGTRVWPFFSETMYL